MTFREQVQAGEAQQREPGRVGVLFASDPVLPQKDAERRSRREGQIADHPERRDARNRSILGHDFARVREFRGHVCNDRDAANAEQDAAEQRPVRDGEADERRDAGPPPNESSRGDRSGRSTRRSGGSRRAPRTCRIPSPRPLPPAGPRPGGAREASSRPGDSAQNRKRAPRRRERRKPRFADASLRYTKVVARREAVLLRSHAATWASYARWPSSERSYRGTRCGAKERVSGSTRSAGL